LLVVQQPDSDESLVDTLLQVMVDAMHSAKEHLSAQTIATTQEIIFKLQSLEANQHEHDLQALDALLDQI
jgi:hypothetical protein